jgi:hypothetical protein
MGDGEAPGHGRNRRAGSSGRGYCWPMEKTPRNGARRAVASCPTVQPSIQVDTLSRKTIMNTMQVIPGAVDHGDAPECFRDLRSCLAKSTKRRFIELRRGRSYKVCPYTQSNGKP